MRSWASSNAEKETCQQDNCQKRGTDKTKMQSEGTAECMHGSAQSERGTNADSSVSGKRRSNEQDETPNSEKIYPSIFSTFSFTPQ